MTFKDEKELREYLVEEGYSKRKQEIYISAFLKRVNIYPYLSKDIPSGRLYQILLGLKQGVDISYYEDYKDFRQGEMELIREGLLQGIDVSLYAKPEYSVAQMKVIKAGIERGLDVSTYADSRLSSSQMWQFYYRMISSYDKKMIKCSNPNFGRFNLEQFAFQRVDFEGIISDCNIISPYKNALVIKNLLWQGEYVCDHIWINQMAKTEKINAEKGGFNFGDYITFSAEVEPYLHNKDNLIHYGLCKMRDIKIINPTDYYKNYELNHRLKVRISEIQYYDKEMRNAYAAESKFRSQYEIGDDVEEIVFEFIGYKRDNLMFLVYCEDRLLKVKGRYNPYSGKTRLQMDYYFSEINEKMRFRKQKLQNTFFQAKYLKMFPMMTQPKDEEETM